MYLVDVQRTIQVVPNAARTTSSLRNLGYDLTQAVADVVDNSVSAGATTVGIDFSFRGPQSWVRIVDNGSGMDASAVTEAFRYGSGRGYAPADLGRFGFGLKTASTSQCRRLTVASRPTGSDFSATQARQLDLDHVEQVDRWEVFEVEPGSVKAASDPLRQQSGTVVLWESLDRILTYRDPWGQWAHERLLKSAEVVDQHLGMVFHRFLAGEVPGHQLAITVNGASVESWDPFCRTEPGTEPLGERSLEVLGTDGMGIVRVRPYVLPDRATFTTERAWGIAGGPARWNQQQGLYVYRAHRMIQSGGWCRIRARDEHTKLARAALEFFPDMDSAFGLNIAKGTVIIPAGLRSELEQVVSQLTAAAETRYRRGNGRRGTPARTPTRPANHSHPPPSAPPTASGRSPSSPAQRPTDRPLAPTPAGWAPSHHRTPGAEADGDVSNHGRVDNARQALEAAASEIGESDTLARIALALRSMHPEIANELGW